MKPTKEDLAKAGVSADLYRQRVRRGWDPARAMSEPPHAIRRMSADLREELKARGIALQLYWLRIDRGWNHERASTVPPIKPPGDSRTWQLRRRRQRERALLNKWLSK